MKSPQTIDLAPLSVRAEVGTVNEEARTVDLIFSTGAPVTRMDYWSGKRYSEVLSMKPEHIRLDRLNAGAPLLDAHSAWSIGDVLGVVEPGSARIEKGQAIATVRFSTREAVEPIWQDVKGGIIRAVSVGYRVHKFEEAAGKKDEIPTRTATDWEPFEVSLVPMPADFGAKVRNGDKSDTNQCVILTRDSQEPVMNEETTQEQPAATAQAQRQETPAAAPANTISAEQRAQIAGEERARIKGITDAVRVAGLGAELSAEMIGRGLTLDAARAEIFTKLEARSNENPTRNHVVIAGEDARDKWLRGAVNWLLVRTGMARIVAKHEGTKDADMSPGEFRGMTLLDLAKDYLVRRNVAFRGKDPMEVAGLAFRSNYQTTSDFAVLLENTLHKVLRAAYAIQPDTWSRFCGVASVSDFRAHNWYRTGALSVLDSLNEHGEFTNKAIPDGEKATLSASTKGNIIAISRQVIVNDDMGSVTRLTEQLGRAGKRTIEVAPYALLAQNGGLGPVMSDGSTLFHANHANIGVGAAASVDAIDADRVLMAQQKDPAGQDFLDLRPSVALVAVGLGGRMREINAQEYNDESQKNQRRPNVVRGLFGDVVDTPRLTGTRRYLFADPNTAPVIVVSFLEGQQEPVLETQDGWRTDGVEMKARLDFGVDVVDFRGAVTNAGV